MFFLLGSKNGLVDEKTILNHPYQNLEIHSFVNKLTLHDVREVIASSKIFIGSDGGLMHIAHSTESPSICLFSSDVDPKHRLTPCLRAQSIVSLTNHVNTITPDEIVDLIKKKLTYLD